MHAFQINIVQYTIPALTHGMPTLKPKRRFDDRILFTDENN